MIIQSRLAVSKTTHRTSPAKITAGDGSHPPLTKPAAEPGVVNVYPKALQRFLNLTPWDSDALRDLVRDYAMERFADARAVLIADPTGFPKKGRKLGLRAAPVLRDAGTC